MPTFSSVFRGPEESDQRRGVAPVPPPQSQRTLDDELAAGTSPQQQEIVQRIYAQLKEGAEVDEVKDLIAKLSRAATDQARKGRGGRNGV